MDELLNELQEAEETVNRINKQLVQQGYSVSVSVVTSTQSIGTPPVDIITTSVMKPVYHGQKF